MNTRMKYGGRLLTLSVILLAGCRAAHDVAVTSFRVIDAPANYIRRQIDEPSSTTTTTTTYQSDSVSPGQPVPAPPPPSSQRRVTSERRSTSESRESSRSYGSETAATQAASSSRSPSTQSPGLPYAKPVPGKQGYVYSPFDPNGGYVDVTGYKPGSKVKDPYSGKIFLVP